MSELEFGEHHEVMTAPAAPPIAVPTRLGGQCSNITITTADGRVFDLGRPNRKYGKNKLRWVYRARLRRYKKTRAAEFAAAGLES